MEHLWAPWRMDYVAGARPEGCVFCVAAAAQNPAEHHVIYRGRSSLVLLNRFPYNSGHVMVVPYEHVSDLTALSREQLCEMAELAQGIVEAYRECLHPDGINLGMNLGQAAGAGIENHLHLHLVPRWHGDTNFITTVGETRVVPQALAASAATMEPVLRAVMERHGAQAETAGSS